MEALERRLGGQYIPANQVERYLVSFVAQVLDHSPLVGIFRLERADTVELHRQNSAHSESFCVQKTELDAVIQSRSLIRGRIQSGERSGNQDCRNGCERREN